MNIVFTGNFIGKGWDGSITDENHIADSLEELGHTVYKIQREDHSALPEFEDISFVLISQYNQYPTDWVSRLKLQYKCPIVLWCFDYQEDGQEWHERLVKECDVYLSKPLRDATKHPNWRWLPQDFAPEFLDQAPPVEKDIEVLFTGSWVPWESGKDRVNVLKAIDSNFDLHIYGVTPDQWKAEGFKNVHGPVMDHGLPALIARAKINLSMDHVWSPGYWSDRNAQIMCCGGFVLFKHVPMSEMTFSNKVAYFYNVEDCLEKIRYYLDDRPDERGIIAERAYKCAQKHHKVGHRVKQLLTIMQEFL